MWKPFRCRCYLLLLYTIIGLLFQFNHLTDGMPTDRTPRRGGVDSIYVNIHNLNLNMSVGNFVLPPWSFDLNKAFAFAFPPSYSSPAAAPTRTPDADGQANVNSVGAWTVIDLPTAAWYPLESYQFLDVGSVRSGGGASSTQVTEPGLEQYQQETARENEATTTTLDDNVTEVIDKNLVATASSNHNNSPGETQVAPGGLDPPAVLLFPLEFETSRLQDEATSRSVLGPGISVAVTAAGIGLALYSLARTYRYLIPLWPPPFPFTDPFNSPNSTLSKTWVSVMDSVNGLNLDDMFTNNISTLFLNSTDFKTD